MVREYYNAHGAYRGRRSAGPFRYRQKMIKIIVTSGRDGVTEQDLPEGGRFFAIPYDPIEITDTLRQWAL